MNSTLHSTIALCDLDNLLLGADNSLPQATREVLQLFTGRGGQFTVFSQRPPRAVRKLLAGVELSAPALVCGGNLAYDFAAGHGRPLRSFAALGNDFLAKLPAAAGVGIALQMQDGSTRVLRMSSGLEKHLRREWTPFLLNSTADVCCADVLRVLLYQDGGQTALLQLLDRALGPGERQVRVDHIAPDTYVLTPGEVSAEVMLEAVCQPLLLPAENVVVMAAGMPARELVCAAAHSVVPADAPAQLRAAAKETTLTNRAAGAAAEMLYEQVRRAETQA